MFHVILTKIYRVCHVTTKFPSSPYEALLRKPTFLISVSYKVPNRTEIKFAIEILMYIPTPKFVKICLKNLDFEE